MNKYESLFRDILRGTRDRKVRWKQLRRTANTHLIFNPAGVFRQYEARLERGDEEYTLLFVEKKYEDPEHDFVYEKYAPELLVVDEGELIVTLSDSVIQRSDLIALSELIEERSDKASKLFGGEI
jgi:hypothetical protein